jgi:hypothetical protein
MKRVFLLIVAPALLAALGFAQTPTATSNTDQTSIKGCLGGTDGNFTIAEDNTGQTFKIATSSVDLKPQVGHDIKLTGHKTSGPGSSGSADNSLSVTEMSMISEHCAAAAAVPAATVSVSPEAISPAPGAAAAPEASVSTPATPPTPDNSASTPAAVTSAPAATPAATPTGPDAIVPAPAAPAEAPKASAITPLGAAVEPIVTAPAPAAAGNATISKVPAAAVEPAATVMASAAPAEPKATVSAPAAAAAHLKHPSARLQKEPAKAAAAATPTADETVKPPVADAAPDATASTPSDTAGNTTPAPAKPAKSSWGMPLGIAIVVLVLLAGATAPLISRWRKRRLLEKTGVQNLAFSHTADSDPGKSDTPIRRKAA